MNQHVSLGKGFLLDSAEEWKDRTVRFLRDLVQIRSVNGQENEAEVAERIVDEADRLGLEVQLVGLERDRKNVIVRLGGGAKGFALVGHTDTVSPGELQRWTYPPYDGVIQKGRLYGRGAADNKAGIACGLYTLAMLREGEHLDPEETRVLLACVVDEESGASSPLGMRYLLDQGLLPVQAAIYSYASEIICIGHRGLLRLVLKVRGESVHSGIQSWAEGKQGVNAVTGLAEILINLESLEIPVSPPSAFRDLGCTITPGTLIRGGEFESMVPGSAEAVIDARLVPGQEDEQVIRRIEEVVADVEGQRPGLSVEIEVKNRLPAAAIPADHRLVTLAQKYTNLITGREWPIAGAGPANEGYMLIESGIPTLCGFGPQGGNAHAVDEWVDLDSLSETIAMYAGIIGEYFNQARRE